MFLHSCQTRKLEGGQQVFKRFTESAVSDTFKSVRIRISDVNRYAVVIDSVVVTHLSDTIRRQCLGPDASRTSGVLQITDHWWIDGIEVGHQF